MTPTPRQAEILDLGCEEALYGGAAGGGKSEFLLMWLAEGAHIPDYAGLILRRTWPQIVKAEGLLAKSRKLYAPMGAVWNGTKKHWAFPSGATIELGHLHHEDSKYDYQGPSYHRCAFDELTQFSESQYLYLMGRLRRTAGFPLVPGMRAASNPGGKGHAWVKTRFLTQEAVDRLAGLNYRMPSPAGTIFYATPTRAFVPARLADNPYLDFEDYVQKLTHLDQVTRERMLNGDWSVRDDARFAADWFRYFTQRGPTGYELLRENLEPLRLQAADGCERFATIDTAGSSADIAKSSRLGQRSQTVVSVWDMVLQTGELIWRDCWHGYWEFPTLLQKIRDVQIMHRCAWLGAEGGSAGSGRAAVQTLAAEGLPIRELFTEGKDKLSRAQHIIKMMESGRVYLDHTAKWRFNAEAELLSYTGHPDDPFDFGDTAAYAGIYAATCGGAIVFETWR